ncbi:unnamed protein product [Nesidiocoris tenuis]|uniref:Pro-resilin n=1 Tax=Nesidiocoris tenuis TaxID=355587 RepID=A0A6H5GMB0_9HEMI|nr:unnamed protein product [Nesidiocoris tenuis]
MRPKSAKVLMVVALLCGAARSDAPSAQYLPPNSGGGGGGGNGYGGSRLGGGGSGFGATGGSGGSGYGGGSGGSGASGYGGSGGGTGGGASGPGEEGGKPEPFSFSYEVKDAESGNDYSHKAESDGNTVRGEYNVLLPDGRRQKVTYTADSQGYNADVQYEGEATSGAGAGRPGGASGPGGAGGYPSGRPSSPGGFGPSAGPSGGSGFGSTGGGSAPGGGYPSGGPSGGGSGGRPSGPSGGGYPSAGGNGGGANARPLQKDAKFIGSEELFSYEARTYVSERWLPSSCWLLLLEQFKYGKKSNVPMIQLEAMQQGIRG